MLYVNKIYTDYNIHDMHARICVPWISVWWRKARVLYSRQARFNSLSGYMQSQGVNDTDDQGPLQDPEHPNGSLPEFQFISVSAFALSTCNLQLLASRVFSHALQGKWN